MEGRLIPLPTELAEPVVAEPTLTITGLSKSFTGTRALDSVSLDIKRGEVHALLGENGSGKSTLIKILAGYHKPDAGGQVLIGTKQLQEGSADASYQLGCRFVHQDLALVETSSVLDNFFFTGGFPKRAATVRVGQTRKDVKDALRRVGLDLDPRRRISDLSPAERTGVAIARAVRAQPGQDVKLLVLDEPTATLAENEVDRLLKIVKQVAESGVSVMYVTHRLEEVLRIADRLTVLRDGRLVSTLPTEGLTRQELLDLLLGPEPAAASSVPARTVLDVDRHPAHAEARSNTPVLRAHAVSGLRVDSVTIDAYKGEIIGIAGITGSGRESLLGIIFGALRRTSGTVEIDGHRIRPFDPRSSIDAGVVYMPSDRKATGGILTFSARINLLLPDVKTFWRWPLMRGRAESREASVWFEKLSVRPAAAQNAMLSTFSGGNQQKVLLAKWLRLNPAVILVDEPTQGVDVGAKAQIHAHLIEAAAAGATILVSSSDADELVALAQRVLVLRHGHIAAELVGDDITIANMSREALTSTGDTL